MRRIGAVLLAWLAMGATISSSAADLPAATKKLLAAAKLDTDVLKGLDDELAMPPGWLEAAAKEPVVRIVATWDPDQFASFTSPFRERYPNIKLSYSRGGLLERSQKPLIALKSGRILGDIIVSPGTDWARFAEIDALADLRELPNFKVLGKGFREENGRWIGQKLAYRCMSYNTNIVPKSELPAKWEDLLTNPFWRSGKLAIPDRPDLWLTVLWTHKGPEWTTDFMRRLFTEVKPQSRKEGASAIVALTVAGELPGAIAAAEYRTKQYFDKGAPVYLHCPEPVLSAVSLIIAMKASTSPNAMKLFLNWFLSKEGQVAQFASDQATPVHKDLVDDPRFTSFAHEVEGKQRILRDEMKLVTENDKLMAIYFPLWQGLTGNKALPQE
jgi:iron(III) transport system substrate-binding protein